MKLKLLTAAASAALMVLPTLAHANDGHSYDDKGWYLRGNVGVGAHTDIEHSGIIIGDTESEANGAATLGFGYDLGENWRLELDGTSLWTDMGKVEQYPNSFAKLRTNTLMVNALYDFEDFGDWAPYVGLGLGKMRASARTQAHGLFNQFGAYQVNPACLTGVECDVNDRDNAWAGQLIAGLGYDISDKLVWDTQYRYQKAFENLGFDGTTRSSRTQFGTGEAFMEDVGAHMLMTGLRYKFGKPSPMVTCWDGSEEKMIGNCPARPVIVNCWDGSSFEQGSGGTCPPEPKPVRMISCWDGSSFEEGSGGSCPVEPQVVQAPLYTCWDGSQVSDAAFCPAETRSGETVQALCGNQYRQEIIYYEFDKGQSAETRNTINRILDIGEYCRVDNIRVVGHTDTSGSAAYNLALSQRRAKDARDELVRQGINSGVISSEGKGETEPFVPTGDGVKEQLNRRTEVLITLAEVGGIIN